MGARAAATPAFRNDGTDSDFENRFGDHHDEATTTTLPHPAAEVDKEMALHGISVFEIVRGAGGASARPRSATIGSLATTVARSVPDPRLMRFRR